MFHSRRVSACVRMRMSACVCCQGEIMARRGGRLPLGDRARRIEAPTPGPWQAARRWAAPRRPWDGRREGRGGSRAGRRWLWRPPAGPDVRRCAGLGAALLDAGLEVRRPAARAPPGRRLRVGARQRARPPPLHRGLVLGHPDPGVLRRRGHDVCGFGLAASPRPLCPYLPCQSPRFAHRPIPTRPPFG